MATLVDTSALLALLSADDEDHGQAVSAFAEFRTEQLVAHNYIVVEATALIDRRLGPAAVRTLHTHLLPPIEIVWVDREVHELAVSALLAAPAVSFVDRVTFELMRRLQIDTAFAFDRDFARQGFDLVP